MKRVLRSMIPVLLGAALGAGCIGVRHGSEALAASDFEAPTADGNPVRLSEEIRKGPVLLYFINAECPCNDEAWPFYRRLHEAYGSSVRFLGIINGPPEVAREWASKMACRFPLVADPDLRIVKDYFIPSSPSAVLLTAGGSVSEKWCGYSVGTLERISRALATAGRVPERPIDTTGAPVELKCGCAFTAFDGKAAPPKSKNLEMLEKRRRETPN